MKFLAFLLLFGLGAIYFFCILVSQGILSHKGVRCPYCNSNRVNSITFSSNKNDYNKKVGKQFVCYNCGAYF